MKTHGSSNQASRREFLKRSAAAVVGFAVPLIAPARVLGLNGTVAPSNRVTVGAIGIGNRGRADLNCMLAEEDVRVVAVCDVRRSHREAAKETVDRYYSTNDCVAYRDMLELLARPDIDAVLIATGDRWHALASLLAAKAGKDVYCEKPCGMNIGQIQALADGMRRYGRVFQAGTQRRSQANFQYAARKAQDGTLGRLHTVHASVYMPRKAPDWLEAEPEPPQEECDWDRWLGPAPWRPYNKRYVSGGWKGHSDFEAAGRFLDWGAHTVDLCQWANGADDTTPVEFEATPAAIVGRYANGVKLICDFLPTPFGDRTPQYRTSTGTCPVRYEGDEGWIETGDSGEIVLSESLLKKGMFFKAPGTSAREHVRNFVDCVKSRAKTICNPDVMRKTHLACFAAQMSLQVGRKLRFDPLKEEFVGDDEANRRRSRAVRAPWSLYI